MSDERADGERAIAELDHFEGEFVAFVVIDPESREPKLGVHPYAEAEAVPEKADRGDVFEIVYDPETEEIRSLEYSEEETEKQKVQNARKLAELQEDEVVSTAEDSTESDESDE